MFDLFLHNFLKAVDYCLFVCLVFSLVTCITLIVLPIALSPSQLHHRYYVAPLTSYTPYSHIFENRRQNG